MMGITGTPFHIVSVKLSMGCITSGVSGDGGDGLGTLM